MAILLAFWAMVSGDELLQGGVALESKGEVFLTRQTAVHLVEISRPAPVSPYLNIQLPSCTKKACEETFSRDRNARRECSDDRSKVRLDALKTSIEQDYAQRLSDIHQEAELLKRKAKADRRRRALRTGVDTLNRNKRDLVLGASILSSALNFSLKLVNNHKIRRLEKIQLHTSKRITALESAMSESMSSIAVAINQTYSQIDQLEEKICSQTNERFSFTLESLASLATDRFLDQLETEISSLATGTLPPFLEYISLWKSGCYAATCSYMSSEACERFCNNLLLDMPSEITPRLIGTQLMTHEIRIFLELRFPIAMTEPTELLTVTSFGIAKRVGDEFVTEAAIVSPFATRINGRLFELDRFRCFSARAVQMVCRANSLSSNTCLTNIRKCPTQKWPSDSPCTYAYVDSGVVVYAAESAEHRIRSIKTDLSRQRTIFQGLHFFGNSEEPQEITCGPLLIPLQMSDIQSGKNVTIENNIRKIDFEFEEDFKNLSDSFEIYRPAFEEELREDILENTVISSSIGTGLLTVIIFVSIVIFKRIRCLTREINVMRPTV